MTISDALARMQLTRAAAEDVVQRVHRTHEVIERARHLLIEAVEAYRRGKPIRPVMDSEYGRVLQLLHEIQELPPYVPSWELPPPLSLLPQFVEDDTMAAQRWDGLEPC